eukprot:TRINITY_DN25366_c0_g1_i1.p1 TRINITY_DN25366_c0_g1~~TRINITY_DN25366_c0_g1_i1.p1  ORF type:complete len:682 (+),score=121.53 TRINITY_DN25366_c0_g1_i1:56-2101(+)
MPQCECGFTCGTDYALRRHSVSGTCTLGKRTSASNVVSWSARQAPEDESRRISIRSSSDNRDSEKDAEIIALKARLREQESEIALLRAGLKDQERKLDVADAEHEKTLDAYTNFVKDIASHSATATLQDYVDFSSKEMLGAGHFGYVFTCRQNQGVTWIRDEKKQKGNLRSKAAKVEELVSDEPPSGTVVVKVQGLRSADTVVREWHHGSETGSHEHLVQHLHVMMHLDRDSGISHFLEESFRSGILKGRQPREFPKQYLIIIEEYMDGGTVQHLMDKCLLRIEGVAAVTRQVADALAFLHSGGRTHNDIKPENVLLKIDSKKGSKVKLVAKLADMGCAVYSKERSRDFDLFGYTIWCMALGIPFKKCPTGADDRSSAVSKLRKGASWGNWTELLRKLPEAVDELWTGKACLQELRCASWLEGHELTTSGSLASESELRDVARKSIVQFSHRKSFCISQETLGMLQKIEEKEAARKANEEDNGSDSDQDSDSQSSTSYDSPTVLPSDSSRSPGPSAANQNAGSLNQQRPSTSMQSKSEGLFSRQRSTLRRRASDVIEPKTEHASNGTGVSDRPVSARGRQKTLTFCDEETNDQSTVELVGKQVTPLSARSRDRGRRSDALDFARHVKEEPASPRAIVGNSALDNLCMRFPELGREVVREALAAARGHAGHAADRLRKLQAK